MWIYAIPHRSGSIDSTRAFKVVSMTRCRRIVHVSTQLDILSSTHVPTIGRGGGRGEEHHLVESSKSTTRRLYYISFLLVCHGALWDSYYVHELTSCHQWLARGSERTKEFMYERLQVTVVDRRRCGSRPVSWKFYPTSVLKACFTRNRGPHHVSNPNPR